MKIAQVNLEADYGGAERHVQMLAQGLQAQGHDVRLYCHPEGRLRREAERVGVVTVPFYTRCQLSPSTPLRMAAHLRRERPDVLHLHTSKDYLCGALAGRLAHVSALVLTRHMLLPLKPLMRQVYSRVDAVVCLSLQLAKQLQMQRIPAARLHPMYGAIDLDAFAAPVEKPTTEYLRCQWGAKPGELVVGCVGRMVQGKGHDALLEALACCRARHLPLRLVLVGAGPLRTALEAQTRRLRLDSHVHFAEFCPNIPQILSGMDIVTVPSTSEELLPLAILEAFAARLPVVATRVGGITEIIPDANTGMLIPPGNIEALANALCCLAADAGLRQKLGEAGAARVKAQFALPRLINDTQNLYARLLTNRITSSDHPTCDANGRA